MIALIHIKKTAGKTLKHIMRCEFGGAHCDVKRWRGAGNVFDATDLRRLRRIHPWLASIAGHSVRSYSDLDTVASDLRFYTFVRDAEKRCISEYQYSLAQGRWPEGSFDRWIEDSRYRNVQTQSLAGCEDAEAAIEQIERRIAFVGLTERFDESMALLQAHLDLPRFTPVQRRVNAARAHRVRDALLRDERAMTRIRRANREDIRVLDYVQREVYPRQKRAAARVSIGVSGAAPRSFNARFVANGLHRHLVYKPAVGVYRLVATRFAP